MMSFGIEFDLVIESFSRIVVILHV